MTILEFAETIRDAVGSQSPIVFKPLPVDDPQTRQPDITLARTRLGWEPKVSLKEGLESTIRYYREVLAGQGRVQSPHAKPPEDSELRARQVS